MNTSSNTNTTNTTNTTITNMTTAATRSIKVNFQGASRDVEVAADQATLAGLQAAIASTFEAAADLPARSGDDEAPKDSDLRFTYKDPDGDSIVFDKDSELSLALRLCPSSLEISAAGKETVKPAIKPDQEHRLYKVAARNLREYNGVPSMTPAKLTTTLAFLKLNPRRLVKQGLAPQMLLARVNKNKGLAKTQPLGDDSNNEDLAESIAAGVEAMNVEEDNKKEWNDGFVSVEPVQSIAAPAAIAGTAAAAAAAPVATSTSDADIDGADAAATTHDDSDDADADEAAKGKHPAHKAFVTGGIKLRPREVWPLLVTLGVRPRRLVKLGHVDAKHLRPMAVAHKKATEKQLRMARSGAGTVWGPWGRGGPWGPGGPDDLMMHYRRNGGGGGAPGGRPCGRGMVVMRRRLHPYGCPHPPPPPPPPHMEEEEGMFFVPAHPAGGGGGGGGRHGGRHGGHRGGHGGPHSHRHPHHGPHHPHHGPPHGHPHPHYGPHGPEDGEGGPGVRRGSPPGMMGMRQGPPGHEQRQHGYYYYWG